MIKFWFKYIVIFPEEEAGLWDRIQVMEERRQQIGHPDF